jgi:Glycosyl hydrolase family 12
MTRTRTKLLRLAVAGLFAGTATMVAIGPAAAADCETSAQYGECTSGSYTFYNDEWGSGYGPQTLWEDSPSDWGVYSTQPSTSGVKAYPDAATPVGDSLDSLSGVTSSFGISVPGSGNWEAAYDIWLNSTSIEVMVWTDTNGDVGPAGSSIGDLTLNGNTWDVYVGNVGHPVYSFVRTSNETSGSVNILGLLDWLQNTKGYFSDPTLSTVDFGWEISGTGDVQEDFTVNSYSLSY